MAQIWDDGGGGGETTDIKNDLDAAELRNNGAAVAAWWVSTTGNPIEVWNTLSHEEKVSVAGDYRELFGRGAGWEDVEEPPTPSGDDAAPPDGSDDIVKHVDVTFMGHRLRVWTRGLMVRIQVGSESRVLMMPDVNSLVQAVDEVNQRLSLIHI